ncbi:MAG: 2-amino-4-hydroxy-6-hydroxymethyldihydropteridine diphosphokinase [Pseudomonadota bacterium]
MIIVALGANLPSDYGEPTQTLQAAVKAIEAAGISVLSRSSIWLTAPVPYDPEVPDYHNAVIQVDTDQKPHDLLQTLLDIEQDFGRVRTVKNAPRLLDLDLIAYNDDIIRDGETLIVPHQRMHERTFVLKPLEEISKKWTHPVAGQNLAELVQTLPVDQQAKKLEGILL